MKQELKKILPEILLLIMLFIALVVFTAGCLPKDPTTNVYANQQPPQQQCEVLTVTGIGQCVPHQQCPPPGYMCQTVINNTTMTYACNPVVGSQQRVCR